MGKFLGQMFKNPEAMAKLLFKTMDMGKPPMTNYQKMKKEQGCCGKGAKSAKVATYVAPENDDW